MKIGESKIMMFDERRAITIHNELNQLLKDFGAKHGLELMPSRARFGTFDFKKKLEFKIKTKAAKVTDELKEKFNFQRYAGKYSYDSKLFNQVVNIGGVEYRVVGVNPRAYKKPIKLVRTRDNRNFKCNAIFLKAAA